MDRTLDKGIWAAQWTLAAAFEIAGMCKLGFQAHHLRPHFGYAAAMTTPMLHRVAAIEIALAFLVVLPALLQILPRLSVLAAMALGVIALAGLLQPSSAAATGFVAVDVALLALAALVAAGRFAQTTARLFEALAGLQDAAA